MTCDILMVPYKKMTALSIINTLKNTVKSCRLLQRGYAIITTTGVLSEFIKIRTRLSADESNYK